MTNHLNKKTFILWLPIVFFSLLLFLGLGNLDAPRQGTEGFYLQIFKEMFQKNSFLTPYHGGLPHWSKPPLHFWAPFPLKSFESFSFLLSGRLSVLLLSLFYIYLVSYLLNKLIGIEKHISFVIHLSSIGFLKYSRIFMMEMSLSYITYIGVLFYFLFKKKKRTPHFIFAAIFLGLSILVKGPISIIMSMIAIGLFELYEFYKNKKLNYKSVISLFALATLIGSIWFILCYQKYGSQFFDYFFLRENLGKFSSQSYPMRRIVQGLIIFTFPWCIVFIEFLKKLFRVNPLGRPQDKFLIFHLIGFCVFFFIWFIPNQRSHHYAMPALPFFLGLFIYFLKVLADRDSSTKSKSLKFINIFFAILNIGIISILFLYPEIIPFHHTKLFFIFALIFNFMAILFTIFLKKDFYLTTCSWPLVSLSLWILVIPSFILPVFPQRAIDLIPQNSPLVVVYRKPFFISEASQKNIHVANPNNLGDLKISSKASYYLPHKTYFKFKNQLNLKILAKWKVWKRGRNLKQIIGAFKLRDFSMLQEEYVLAIRQFQP